MKYPKVNYIGNKEKITEWIIENFPVKNGIVLDLFSGGAAVSYALKNAGYQVISNDVLYSNYALAQAFIENNQIVLSFEESDLNNIITESEEKKYKEIYPILDELYFEDEIRELAKLIIYANKYNNIYEKYLYISLIRRAMIRKLPYSRMNIKWSKIQQLRNEEYSYLHYKRRRAYHNETFINHIKNNLQEYNDAVFSNNKTNMAVNKDALQCVKELESKVDVVYLDPPYPNTLNNYIEFYGKFDLLFDKEIKTHLNFISKKTFLENFLKLVEALQTKTNYIVLSLNNKCLPGADEILEVLKNFGDCKICTKEHNYKLTNKESKKQNLEILIIAENKAMKNHIRENRDVNKKGSEKSTI